MYTGGHTNSGFNINGWNWIMVPGATTIHLPWDDLEAEQGRQDERTDSNFAASLRFKTKSTSYIDDKLEGEYGVFGMDFNQKAISSSHDASFTFKKSMFFFDGKIICLGSNINNNDTSNTTATNLFQNYLSSTSGSIVANNTTISAFPYANTLNGNANNWLVDNVSTGYFVKSGNNIIVDRKSQSSPSERGNGTFTNGNFASAYINHGTNPTDAGYEYVVVPNTTTQAMSSFSSSMDNNATAFYKLMQKDATAHIIKRNNMFGYALFASGNYDAQTPLKSNNKPALVVLKETNSRANLDFSVVSPDLNFAANGGESQSVTIDLVFHGLYALESSSGGTVSVIQGAGETTVQVTVKDGLPADVALKDISSTTGTPLNVEDGNWSKILGLNSTTDADVLLENVNDDDDNGDGIGDGALHVDGKVANTGQGAYFKFGGNLQVGKSYEIKTVIYNTTGSYVTLDVVLFNITDNKQLAISSNHLLRLGKTPPEDTATITFNYVAQASDDGDELEIRCKG
jgi:hypothetical protein